MREHAEVEAFGTLKAGDNKYWLLAPFPVNNLDDWITEKDSAFFVVPFIKQLPSPEYEYDSESNRIVYPAPRFIVVRGDYIIEWLEGINLLVRKKKEEKEERHIDKLKRVTLENYVGWSGYLWQGE